MPPISGGAEVQTTSTGWRGIEASLSLVFATAGCPDCHGACASDGAERIRAPRVTAMVDRSVGRTARLGRTARRDVAFDRVALSDRPRLRLRRDPRQHDCMVRIRTPLWTDRYDAVPRVQLSA